MSVIAVLYFHIIKSCHHLHCNRFIEASTVFGVNQSSVKLATDFMLLRILRINDEESWSKYDQHTLYAIVGNFLSIVFCIFHLFPASS